MKPILKFATTLFVLSLVLIFTSCTKDDLLLTEKNAEQTTTSNSSTTNQLTTSAHWKKYIEKIAKSRDFDYLEIYDQTGKLLYHWHVSELRFDLNAPQAVVFISEHNSIPILYDDILKITRKSDKTITEQLLVKAEPSISKEGDSNRATSTDHWKNYFKRMATNQNFDSLEILDDTKKLLYQWNVREVKFDLSNPDAVMLTSENERVKILYSDILNITRVADETVTEMVMVKAESSQ